MSDSYTIFRSLADEAPIPARGILSQTLSNEGGVEFIVFGFAPGERLSEHTSTRPAIIHVLSGEGELTVDGDVFPAAAGTWLRMLPRTPHGVTAKTPLLMALYLL